MKVVSLACLCLIFISSCTPTNDVKPTPPGDSTSAASFIIDTIKIYRIGPQENNYSIAKFRYDDQGRLNEIYSTDSDTTLSGVIYPDTSSTIFTYTGSDVLPSLYTEWISVNPVISGDGHINHVLNFDTQGRVLIDSETQASGYNGPSIEHYQYGTEYIARANSISVDTIYLEANNMIRYDSYIVVSPGILGLGSQELFAYTTYSNPFYIPNLSNHIGPIFPTTMLSPNLYSQQKNIFISGNISITNYTWNTNAEGQVIYGVGTDEASGKPIEYYWYIYRKK